MEDRENKAARLERITQRVGFTLGQLQEFEAAAAEAFVLLAKSKKGMGHAAGNSLVEEARGKTFGVTVKRMKDAGILSAARESRFRHLLNERNWLVHRSRDTSRNAIESDAETEEFIQRINAIGDETMQLMREMGSLAENYVRANGVTQADVDAAARALRDSWQSADWIEQYA